MSIRNMISVPLIGPVRHDFEEIARSVVERAGLRFVSAKGENTTVLTVTVEADTVDALKAVDGKTLVKRLQRELTAMPSAGNTTHIDAVYGPVHTGSGDVNVSVSIEVLWQKMEAALTAAGVGDPEKRKTALQKFLAVLQELGTDVAAKFAAEMARPG